MLYSLLAPLGESHTIFNVVRYLTFRTGAAIVTALVVCFILGPSVINWLKVRQKKGQPIRSDGPAGHLLTKQGTPTMGGVLMLLSLAIATFLWADLKNPYVWVCLAVTLACGTIGFIDDFMKVTRHSHRGVPGRLRLLLECVIGGLAAYAVMRIQAGEGGGMLAIPFAKSVLIDLGWFFIPFGAFIVVGAANAVNLTDGLDGLAIGPVIIAAGTFTLITYLVGNAVFANYLQIHPVPGAGELTIFTGAIIGAGLGFLWFNAPPAMVFMGDTGSLALGGALGAISLVTKHELVLAIVGGLFVLETVSVIVQVASFKLTGRRVFRMAPLHHHYEQKGWAESTIVIRFWIIAGLLALVGLATLKLR